MEITVKVRKTTVTMTGGVALIIIGLTGKLVMYLGSLIWK